MTRARPPRLPLRRFGLRPRFLLALVATALVTLMAAALALFGPLQDRLRDQQAGALQTSGLVGRGAIEDAINQELREKDAISSSFGAPTADEVRRLTDRIGGFVAVVDTTRTVIAGSVPPGDRLTDVDQVLNGSGFKVSREEDRLRGAFPLGTLKPSTVDKPPNTYFALVLRQREDDVSETVSEVRRAFLAAAIIGLVAALALGLVLATTLTRRLERLRESALRITRDGINAPPPTDDAPDEVGDLARAMARMQRALHRQEDARRQFVATASHELRTPLTSLSGNLELLSEDLADEAFDREDARAQVEAARGQLRAMRNLATELLDLSRLDADIALRSEPVELGEVARAVAAEFALQAAERRSALEVIPPRGPCWARGDPDAVARVCRILIDNALRYCPTGTAIRVTTDYAGSGAIVAVDDDGPGVAAAEAEEVFERFRRGAETQGQGGFGLGLAIGRELAQRMGGGLELDDRHRPGARFVLTLPIELPAGAHGAAAQVQTL